METVNSGKPPEPFIPPKGVNGVIIDVETGGIAVNECEKQRLVYVKEKDMPQKLCTDKVTAGTALIQAKTMARSLNYFRFRFLSELGY